MWKFQKIMFFIFYVISIWRERNWFLFFSNLISRKNGWKKNSEIFTLCYKFVSFTLSSWITYCCLCIAILRWHSAPNLKIPFLKKILNQSTPKSFLVMKIFQNKNFHTLKLTKIKFFMILSMNNLCWVESLNIWIWQKLIFLPFYEKFFDLEYCKSLWISCSLKSHDPVQGLLNNITKI